ncbi:MAG TPA: hypothetical protein P5120_03055 [Spirochaetota bacterium]|nr:hypothetical protein [Spirochaetota bacterium]HPR37884.1 hypothetical protein [Spirochaetota bacterium]HRX46473.1 hypothetical protein [Spirochaetota bacterium]
MRKFLVKILLVAAAIKAFAGAGYSADDKGPGEIGRVLFKNESSAEVMVLSSVETPSLYIAKGSVLDVVSGSLTLKISVTDICGMYIRCKTVNNGGSLISGIKEGDAVFLSVSGNETVKYSDVKILLSALIKLYEDFIYKVESVDEPAVISEYVGRFSEDLEKLLPEMERLNSKYPELLKFYSEPPAELKYESEALKLIEPALGNVFFKIKTYEQDPSVKKSLEKLQKVLKKMRSAGK